jgi:hypothetical protein
MPYSRQPSIYRRCALATLRARPTNVYALLHTFQHHCAPLAFAESVVVGRSFNLRPFCPPGRRCPVLRACPKPERGPALPWDPRHTGWYPLPPHSLTEMFKDVEMVRHELC